MLNPILSSYMSDDSFKLVQAIAKNEEVKETAIIQENCAIVKRELIKVLNHELTRDIQDALKTNKVIRGNDFILEDMAECQHPFSLNSFAMNKCKLPMSHIDDELSDMFKHNMYINPKVTIYKNDSVCRFEIKLKNNVWST